MDSECVVRNTYLLVGILEVVEVDLVCLGKCRGLVQGLDGDGGGHGGDGGHPWQGECQAWGDGGGFVEGKGDLDVGGTKGV